MIKVALAIDGLNILKAAAQLNKRVDLAMLLHALSDNGKRDILFKNFYIGPPGSGNLPAGQYDAVQREVEEMGYTWICCELPGSRPDRVKSTVDVTIVMDVMTWASSGRIDIICLASGDGHFAHAVHRAREMGVKVCVMGIISCGHMSNDLMREIRAGEFLDLEEMGMLRPLTAAPGAQGVTKKR